MYATIHSRQQAGKAANKQQASIRKLAAS